MVRVSVRILVYEQIEKLNKWWWLNKEFSVKDNYAVQKLLDIFFG